MRIFLDENMPRALRSILGPHEVSFVEREGWKGSRNGELLTLVEASFDVFVTSDGNLEFQNELSGRSLSLVVMPTNNLTILRANAVALRSVLEDLAELGYPAIVVIDWKGRRTMRRLDERRYEAEELTPIPFLDRSPPQELE